MTLCKLHMTNSPSWFELKSICFNPFFTKSTSSIPGILRLNAGINQLNNWSSWYTPYIEHLKVMYILKVKSVRLKKRQLFEMVILRPFLLILLPTTLIYLTKLRFWQSFLRCINCLNLNWIKSYDINHKCFWQLSFSILEEKNLKI